MPDLLQGGPLLVDARRGREWRVTVIGEPRTKGDLRCYGRGGMHRLSEVTDKPKRAWRSLLASAGRQILAQAGQLLGPVEIRATFTLPRPRTVSLVERAWPHVKYSGDTDKLQRMLLDALAESELIVDDAQVVHLDVWKGYPDTPGCPDLLDQPGAVIRIRRTDT